MVGDWTLKVVGEVVRIERENVDKSGRNPRYFLTFVIRPEQVDGVPEGAAVPAEIPIRIKDAELARMAPTPPAEGSRVVMRAKTNGPAPTSFYLTAVE